MYLHPRCLGRSSVSLAVSLGVFFTCGGLLGRLAGGGLAGGSTTPQQHRNWHGAARRLATAAVARALRSAGGSTSGLVCYGYGRQEAAHRGSSATVRSAGGSTSGLICYGPVGARRVFSAFVFLARGGVGLSVCGVEPSCVGHTAAAGQPLPSSLVAEPPKIPPPCLPTLRRTAPSSCLSASLPSADQPRAAASLPPFPTQTSPEQLPLCLPASPCNMPPPPATAPRRANFGAAGVWCCRQQARRQQACQVSRRK